jgi:hypothetical protein
MKKFSYLMILLGSLALSSCDEKFLTKDNPTATTDEKWWKTEPQALAALSACYSAVPTGAFVYVQNSRISFSALTDEAVWTANFFAEIPTIALGNASPASGTVTYGYAIEPLWTNNFSAIRNCNRFLEHATKTYTDPDNLNRYLLEARALRAWYHLDLFLYYGAIPIVTSALPPNEAELKRNTKEEVINFITSELEACAAGLPVSYSGTTDNFRMTKGACLAMEADAFLNAGMYAQAAVAAKKVIDLGYYQLYKNTASLKESYKNLFENTGILNNEWIFLGSANKETFYRNAPPGAGGTANVNPTGAAVDAYETKQGKTIQELGPDSVAIYEKNPNYRNNRDPRLAATIISPGETFYVLINPFAPLPNVNAIGASNSSRTGYFLKKYVDLADRTRNTKSPIPFMLYRYAGVLLTYVEALVESGQWNHPDVVKYLNEIRNRAGMPNVNTTVYNNEAKMRELYRRERRVELAFEGFRLFDIRRWHIGEQVMNGPVSGATNPANGQTVIVESRTFSEKHYLWPIPQRELDGNSLMTQNPGY